MLTGVSTGATHHGDGGHTQAYKRHADIDAVVAVSGNGGDEYCEHSRQQRGV